MPTTEELSWDEIKAMVAALSEQSRRTEQALQALAEQMKETDRRMKETDRRIKETDRQMKATDRKIGRLGNRLGEFVESMVEPALVELFRRRGLPVHQVMRRLEAMDDAGHLVCEVDLLVIDSAVAVAVECKSRATVADVDEHLQRLGCFKQAFPRFADLRLQGAIAAMSFAEGADRYAYRQGLYVLAPSGETVTILNDADFQPREW
ncbi:MAG: DUF3782 domain-containing protein [Thiobacillaceae bacterium]|nr:DUF3782 domain-containing protein [Thiobacillaceae bacterium]MCX7673933.1 DUF3782 domain-containing protein [Thiobacillaceae bacterium]